jgi:Fe-S cluster biogenesis protein NfuA
VSDRADLRAVGDRIEALLGELRASLDQRAWELVEEVVGLVTELYGGGLERVVELVSHDDFERLVADDLVASLLVLHGLHPLDLDQRVRAALDGTDAEVLRVDEAEGVLHLRMAGSADSCGRLGLEQAIEAAAPEIVHIDVATPTPVTLRSKGVSAG